jgi:hypothetical protein
VVMQCQVSFALGKDGSAPIGDGLGMGAMQRAAHRNYFTDLCFDLWPIRL